MRKHMTKLKVLSENTLYESGKPVGAFTLEEGQKSDKLILIESFTGPECNLREVSDHLGESTKQQLTEKSGKGILGVFEGRFQMSDTKNANGRQYPSALWDRLCAADSKQIKWAESGEMLGECDHPKDGETLLQRVTCMTTKFWRNESDQKEILGRMVVFDTQKGRDLMAIHNGGGKWGVSSRGQGSLVRMDGVDVVQDDFQLETWDIVFNPSTPNAFPSQVTESTMAESEMFLTEGMGPEEFHDQLVVALKNHGQGPEGKAKRDKLFKAVLSAKYHQDPETDSKMKSAATMAYAAVAKESVEEANVEETLPRVGMDKPRPGSTDRSSLDVRLPKPIPQPQAKPSPFAPPQTKRKEESAESVEEGTDPDYHEHVKLFKDMDIGSAVTHLDSIVNHPQKFRSAQTAFVNTYGVTYKNARADKQQGKFRQRAESVEEARSILRESVPAPSYTSVLEAVKGLREGYKSVTGAKGPLTTFEINAITERAKEILSMSEATKEPVAEVSGSKTSTDGLQDRLEAQTAKTLKAVNEVAELKATVSEHTTQMTAAKQVIEHLRGMVKTLGVQLREAQEQYKAATKLAEALVEESSFEVLKTAVESISATHKNVPGLSESLSRAKSVKEMITIAQEAKKASLPRITREPLTERESQVLKALEVSESKERELTEKASKPLVVDNSKSLDKLTERVMSAAKERGLQ
jgi:hypothetical protein